MKQYILNDSAPELTAHISSIKVPGGVLFSLGDKVKSSICPDKSLIIKNIEITSGGVLLKGSDRVIKIEEAIK